MEMSVNNEEIMKCVMCGRVGYKIYEKTKEILCEECWRNNESIEDERN